MSPERVSVREEGESHPIIIDGPKREKALANSGESGARDLEAESIRSRAESTGGSCSFLGL